jgi:hypothetical protein
MFPKRTHEEVVAAAKMPRGSKLVPIHPKDIDAKLPWERDEVHYTEVPAVLKHEWNLTVRHQTIYRWIRKGRTGKDGVQYYLKSHTRVGRVYVKLDDLKTFLEMT